MQAARYIKINRHLTGDLDKLEKFLPSTKSGRVIGMANKGINSKKENITDQWVFGISTPDTAERMEMAARVTEIGIRVLFENFTYQFGGKYYLQLEGGPIGARSTMAAGRMVMAYWGMLYRSALNLSKMELLLLKGYVDDVRQGGMQLRYGLRWDTMSKGWKWTEKEWLEDLRRRKDGELPNERMKRICLPLMNSISKDLRFTAEIEEEFPSQRLPTLDFELWIDHSQDGMIKHNYFQKKMKIPFVVMKKSAME